MIACTKPPPPAGSESGTGTSTSTSTSASTDTDTDADAGDGDPSTETGQGELPPVPSLLSPVDGASDLPLELELCWELVDDPDGDPVRYHVYVDDTLLEDGVLGDEGHEGPCIGPLLFAHGRTYTWQVEAFEAADPTRSSGKSELWSFSTIGDGLSELVFADGFDEDLGWEISGVVNTGAWVRGDPVAASDGEPTSQPAACAGGSSCFFTGQNPLGVADDADVSGGTTILLSPSFDLGDAAAATIELSRFFYKSGLEPGPSLVVELLVPNELGPDGYDAYVLEQLDSPTSALADNRWTPREYAACGLPMLDGSRLRISASDTGAGILEAAIDSVAVRAFDDAGFCNAGLGGRCDPAQPDSCPVDLSCCSQGPLNVGVYRCTEPVAGLDYQSPPASPDDPGNGAIGCDAPDLIVDTSVIEPLIFTDIFIDQATCELLEGCVATTGWRHVMLFAVSTPNIGSKDLALGVPANHPELFHYSDCHNHYHFDEYARYELRDADANVVARGHKQAFCMLDTLSWAWPFELGKFDCTNQGISRGFYDTYDSGLPCQWVDVTDVPPGDYTLRIALNQPREDQALPVLNERDYANNVVEVPVVIP
jgi:hypothetical protein